MRKPSQQLKVIDVPTHEVSIAQYVALVMFLWHWYVFTPNPSQTVRLSASCNVQTCSADHESGTMRRSMFCALVLYIHVL